MNCEEIKQRNREKIEELIDTYNIKEKFEDLIKYYTSVYIHKDFKQRRMRLLGIKDDLIAENKRGATRKRTVQLYVLSKRMIQSLPKDSVFNISYDLSLFAHYFNELKLIYKLEQAETKLKDIVSINMLTENNYEQLKQ